MSLPIDKLKFGDPVSANWRKINPAIQRVEAQADQIELLSREIAKAQQNQSWHEFHPFRIYVHPQDSRTSPASDDWRKIRVRSGIVLVSGVDYTLSGVDDCDEPDSGMLATTGDITVPENTAQYWVWLVLTTSGTPTATVSSGATPPSWDATHLPIGYVDTDTNAAEKYVVIRQIQRTDVIVQAAGAPPVWR